MLKLWDVNNLSRCSSFSTAAGAEEYFLTIGSTEQTDFASALTEIKRKYNELMKTAGLSDDTAVFSRLHLGDIENRKDQLRQSPLWQELLHGSVSVIQQRPIFCGPLSFFSYHVKLDAGNHARPPTGLQAYPWRNGILVKGANYSMLWTCNFFGTGAFDSAQQTQAVFNDLAAVTESNGMNLLNNTIRTWVFVRDVDNLYRGMVQARRSFFAAKGLTEKTRYLASTGIEGRSLSVDSIVHLDCLSIGGLAPEQIVRMQALENLSPTIEYGVTFERGLRVCFGDRSHLYISGTASINKKGEVMHVGDVKKQTERTIENIEALLQNQGAELKHMGYLFVYLRDSNDRDAVRKIVEKHFSANIPCIYAEAPVCRPAWLVEIEGVGVKEESMPYKPFL